MAEYQHSALLREVLEASKKIGNQKPYLTAERFVAALIDRIQSGSGETENKELAAISEAMKEMIGDLEAAREQLDAYINRDEGLIGSNYSYMILMLHRARGMAQQLGVQEIDTVNVFMCIVQQPSDAIKKVLDPAAVAALADGGAMRGAKIGKAESPQEPQSDIASVVSKVKEIRKTLQSRVFGQDNAINVFLNGYFQAHMPKVEDTGKKRPRATFLFAGPPGVGKTMLAKEAAKALGMDFCVFDMSGYADKEANIEFCGSDKAYRNSKPGNVTDFVAKHPKCVLLFDEIEKAHSCVIHLFLQMLDSGRLRDSYSDQEVSFADTIIIFTTNAGKQLYEASEGTDLSGIARKVVIDALQKDINPITKAPFFPPAICSRFAAGNVVMFNHIGVPDLYKIARNEFRDHVSVFEKKNGIRMEIDERIYTALLFSEGSNVDARIITGRARAFFNDELFELFRLVSSEKVKTDIDTIEKIKINVDLECSGPEITKLFGAGEQKIALVFADPETVERCQQECPGISVTGVRNLQEAIDIVKNQDIHFVLLDLKCGANPQTLASLNAEDVVSTARDFFKYLKEYRKDLPVYYIEQSANDFGEEEKISFMKQGVRGVLPLTNGERPLGEHLKEIAAMLHQQASMIDLSVANKLVSYETAQTVSGDGKTATINLFDFKLSVAVASEDADSVLSGVSRPDVCFDDVIGAGDAKRELTSFVQYLQNPKKYMGSGLKAPRGIILYGPPGTGKTMLAKALAHESGVTFIATEGNQFRQGAYGESAEEVHKKFKIARKYAPAILFVDEIDTIAKDRKGGGTTAATEEALTAFLTEMDGFGSNPSKPVFVLAATNFDVEPGSSTSLDPALMRRFDRRIYMDLPNKEDRTKYLNKRVSENSVLQISEEMIKNIAVRSTGMSLAELESVTDLALRLAIREGGTIVNDAIFEEAFETFNSGDAQKWSASQLERVARHEAGHALLCWLGGETPSYLTVVARGNHGGYMQHGDQENKATYTKDDLLKRIRTALGGRAAELVCYGEREGLSTGAGSDLVAATNMAKRIMCAYGMDEDFGLAVVNTAAVENMAMSAEIRTAVNRILKEQMSEAVRLISENREKFDVLVNALVEKDHLNGTEINEVLTNGALKAE